MAVAVAVVVVVVVYSIGCSSTSSNSSSGVNYIVNSQQNVAWFYLDMDIISLVWVVFFFSHLSLLHCPALSCVFCLFCFFRSYFTGLALYLVYDSAVFCQKKLKTGLKEIKYCLGLSHCYYYDVSMIETVHHVIAIVICLGARQCSWSSKGVGSSPGRNKGPAGVISAGMVSNAA